MEYIWDNIGKIAGVITIVGFIAGIRYFRPKSISQKTSQFGIINKSKSTIINKTKKK